MQKLIHCAVILILMPIAGFSLEKDLVSPVMTSELPAAGKRVKQVSPEFKGTDVYHALYLPVNWKRGNKYPVIVEYTGNKYAACGSSGEVKDANLAYGLSGGKALFGFRCHI